MHDEQGHSAWNGPLFIPVLTNGDVSTILLFPMNLSDYDFDLPQELIAQEPVAQRDQSRLLVLDRGNGRVRHMRFADIAGLVAPSDVLIVNQTRVFPARLHGVRAQTGGKVELLLIARDRGGNWLAMGKPGRALQVKSELVFADGALRAVVVERTPEGRVRLQFDAEDIMPIVEQVGQIPLPPYIRREATRVDAERYQTVFARSHGAIAAPTAGLHFTQPLLQQIGAAGTAIEPVLLHVGPGTFEPVRTSDPRSHRIEAEYYEIPATTAEEVNRRRRAGGRIIAVGTTSVRALETAVDGQGLLHEASGWTEAFIYPPYAFGAVDALVTNFHLPKSTLLMLVAAFAGYDYLMSAYAEAVREGYRFYSYGDAMMVV